MSNIQTFLQNILSARYGKDVRQSIHDAIEEVDRVADTAQGSATEAAEIAVNSASEAEQYRTEAKQYRDEAVAVAGVEFATTEKAGLVKPDGKTILIDPDGTIHSVGGPGGGGTVNYEELENKPKINGVELDGEKTLEDLGIASAEDVETLETELEKTTYKVDTVIAHTDLGIKETASGEEIHLNDSAEGKAVEYALYGKARQNTTTGKNLMPIKKGLNATATDVTVKDNGDSTLSVIGTSSEASGVFIYGNGFLGNTVAYSLKAGTYYCSGVPDDLLLYLYKVGDVSSVISSKGLFTLEEDTDFVSISLRWLKGATLNYSNLKIMINSGETALEWEPYTNGASPNPQFPQPIEVSGESYNLLPYPYKDSGTKTTGGITFVETDGLINANGTATGTNPYFIIKENWICPKGEYIISGCPNGGSGSNYYIRVNNATQGTQVGNEVGNGLKFTTNGTDAYTILVIVSTNAKVENLTFYPMIRKATVKNDRYMPFGVGSVEVKSVGKNLIPYPYYQASKTDVGITWESDKNGVVTANGTATSNTALWQHMYTQGDMGLKKNVKYKLNGISGGNTTTYQVCIVSLLGTTQKEIFFATNGDKEFEFTQDFDGVSIYCRIASGTKADNLVFKPMLRLATDTDDTYQPYKETLATIPTPNGLAGIKVSSGGNYTDQNGQQWICDEVVKFADGSGVLIQRVKKVIVTSKEVESAGVSTSGTGEYIATTYKDCMNNNALSLAISNKANAVSYNNRAVNGSISRLYVQSGVLFIAMPVNSGFFTNTYTAKEWVKNNEFECMYALAEPITTPLTAEQLAEIETFYPVTNISNDFDCGMSVKYNCDSKNYIDNQLALQAQAREQEMMSMFLLLPEETQAAMIENDVNNLLAESEI